MVLATGTQLGIFIPTGHRLEVLVGGTVAAPIKYVAQVVQDYPRKVVIRGGQLFEPNGGYVSGKPTTLTVEDVATLADAVGTGLDGLGEPANIQIQGYAYAYSDTDGTRIWEKLSDAVDNVKDTNGDGVVDDKDEDVRSGNWLTDAWTAAKANPVPYAIGLVVVGFVVYKVIAAIALANAKGGKKKSGGFRLF
jgi:hypothetical protein